MRSRPGTATRIGSRGGAWPRCGTCCSTRGSAERGRTPPRPRASTTLKTTSATTVEATPSTPASPKSAPSAATSPPAESPTTEHRGSDSHRDQQEDNGKTHSDHWRALDNRIQRRSRAGRSGRWKMRSGVCREIRRNDREAGTGFRRLESVIPPSRVQVAGVPREPRHPVPLPPPQHGRPNANHRRRNRRSPQSSWPKRMIRPPEQRWP